MQLSGFPRLRRAKSGEYRIIFQIVEDVIEIHILRVGKRNDDEVYKNLENL
ncbi:type II toxin-antitoxin system RelE family toxin [Moraxella equi]|uniref:type II toxin-antitoxin system RelE family toxin n=1 Tax=Moraxella equi TaxID=60442 RepID=UPI003B8384C5